MQVCALLCKPARTCALACAPRLPGSRARAPARARILPSSPRDRSARDRARARRATRDRDGENARKRWLNNDTAGSRARGGVVRATARDVRFCGGRARRHRVTVPTGAKSAFSWAHFFGYVLTMGYMVVQYGGMGRTGMSGDPCVSDNAPAWPRAPGGTADASRAEDAVCYE